MSEREAYLISEQLYKAIKELFPNPTEGTNLLGLDKMVLPSSWYRSPLAKSEDPIQRAVKMRAQIEKDLVQMGKEVVEFGNQEDLDRLRNEARGLLLALHELWLHFPEVADVQ